MADKPTDDDLASLLAFARDSADRIVASLRFNYRKRQHLYAVSLYLTIVDYADAVLRLRGSRGAISIPNITRAALDAYVDMENVIKDPAHCDWLEWPNDKEWHRLLDRAHNTDNPYFRGIKNSGVLLHEGLALHAKKIEELKKKGIRKLQAHERYERVGRTAEYEAIYTMLSGDVHNSIITVVLRHFDIDTETETIRMRERSFERFEGACLLLIAEAIIRASELLLRLCGHGSAAVSDARQQLDRIHASLPDEARV